MILGAFCAIVCTLPLGQLTITGNQIRAYGVQVGVYVDNEDPAQAADVTAARKSWQLVIAGIPQGLPAERFPGAVNALEWYPYWGGIEHAPPPPARAYILQDRFSWDGRPPTPAQRARLHRQAARYRPLMILDY